MITRKINYEKILLSLALFSVASATATFAGKERIILNGKDATDLINKELNLKITSIIQFILDDKSELNESMKKMISLYAQSDDEDKAHIATLTFLNLSLKGNKWAKEKIFNCCISKNLNELNMAKKVLEELVLKNNEFGIYTLIQLIQSKNIHNEVDIAVQVFMGLILQDNEWAKKTILDFAKSNNSDKIHAVAITLANLVLNSNYWAKETVLSFS
jgi:hypothetical protein